MENEINSNNIQELKRLSKQANQRILRIERLTKRKSPAFAVKELADLLSVTKGLTKRKGKSIRASAYKKSMTPTDVAGSIKALKQFIENTEGSTVKGIKKYIAGTEARLGKKIKPHEASAIYIAGKEWEWIKEYTDPSDFWNYYNYEFSKSKPTVDEFIEYMKIHLFDKDLQIDENLKTKLEKLYNYLSKDL